MKKAPVPLQNKGTGVFCFVRFRLIGKELANLCYST